MHTPTVFGVGEVFPRTLADLIIGKMAITLTGGGDGSRLPLVPFEVTINGRQFNRKIPLDILLSLMQKSKRHAVDVELKKSKVYRFLLPTVEELYAAVDALRLARLKMFQTPALMQVFEADQRTKGRLRKVTAEQYFGALHISGNALLIALATRFRLPALYETGLLDGYRIEGEHLGAALPRVLWANRLGDWLDSIFASANQSSSLGLVVTPLLKREIGSGLVHPEHKSKEPYADPLRLLFYMQQPGYTGLRANSTAVGRLGRVTDEYMLFILNLPIDPGKMIVVQDNPWVGHSAYVFVGPLKELLLLLTRRDEADEETRRVLKESPYFIRALNHNNREQGAGDWMPRFGGVFQGLRNR